MSDPAVMDGLTGAAATFSTLVEEALAQGRPDDVPDAALQRLLAAAVRLYAAKSESRELSPFGDQPVNATAAVTAICAFMRAADLNFFDLQMWYRRGKSE